MGRLGIAVQMDLESSFEATLFWKVCSSVCNLTSTAACEFCSFLRKEIFQGKSQTTHAKHWIPN